MKRLICLLFALVLLMPLAVAAIGCTGTQKDQGGETGRGDSSDNNAEDTDKITLVCTIFPLYDWTRRIIGMEESDYQVADRFELIMLLDGRVDLHSYTPSVRDMASIKTADVFIYTGGDSDNWAKDVLTGSNPDMVTLNLVDYLGDKIIIEAHDEEDCDLDHDHSEPHTDEHIWLSLQLAELITTAIANLLSEIDPENTETFMANLSEYNSRLSDLDEAYQATVAAANVNTLVFADRFPFAYLAEDYGLTYFSAFSGCSAETEASFVTIISLATRLDQLGLNTVMVTECSDQAVARTVIENTKDKNQQILVLDSMQSVTSSDVQSGLTYLSIMESNLEILREALR